jgi:RND superfamily putative drug exporter
MIVDGGLDEPPSEHVLITSRSGGLDNGAAQQAAAAIKDQMTGVVGVTGVGDPIASPDGTSLLVPIALASDEIDPQPLLDVTARVQQAHQGVAVQQAGDVSIGEAINDRVGDDLATAEVSSVPITLVLMLLAFGALIAAGLPVLLAASSVVATMGIIAPISHLVPADTTVNSMIVLIGMAVGVDYSLFYLKRERQEREAGRTTLDAVTIAAEASGHAILVSGGAVIAALAGLFVLTDVTFNSLATGSIVVVAVAVLGSITVLPALLVKLGRWVDRPRIPVLWRVNRRIGRGGISGRLLTPVVRHPLAALAVAGVVIGVLAIPAFGLKTHMANVETLPDDITEVQTFKAIATAFPSQGTSASVVVAGDPADRAVTTEALRGLAARATETGTFTSSDIEVRTSDDGATSVVELPMPFDESDDRAAAGVELLRSELAPAALGQLDAEWAVGGAAAESLDFTTKQQERMPLLLGIVLLLTFLMMAVSFRSLVLGAVSTLLNLASVGVAFGVLALVFQHGVGESLLGTSGPGFVINWIPIFVLVVLVGLSMDYHVFVLSRVRELVAGGMPTRQAVHRGIADTAGVVTSAAAVMVSVFTIFATLSMLEMKMLGIGLAAAILLDATLIRLVVLPAILVLLGERAWWPSRPTPKVEPAPVEPALAMS